MENRYIITWKARISGRTGHGKKIMDKPEAERVAAELNEEYPEYEHTVVAANGGADEQVAQGPVPELESNLTQPARSELRTATQPSSEQPEGEAPETAASEGEVSAYDNHPRPASEPEKEAA